MIQSFKTTVLAACLALSGATVVEAHAFLDHAVPGVGATVAGSPGQVELSFTEGVVPALSGVTIATAGGAPVPAAKPVGSPGSPDILIVRLGRPLPAGGYVVTWHVVSTDTHRTSGSYRFTVAP